MRSHGYRQLKLHTRHAWHRIRKVEPSHYKLIDLKSSDSRATNHEPTDGQSADTQCTKGNGPYGQHSHRLCTDLQCLKIRR